MDGQDLQSQVYNGYQELNNSWTKIHYRLLFYYTLVSGIMEILMFCVILKTGALNCSVGEYWLKYIIVPLLLNSCITVMGAVTLRSEKISVIAKQYIISLLYVALAFVLELMHSGYIAVLVVAVFPILITIIYENQKLTAIVAFCSAVTQAISGFWIFWDTEKELNSAYIVNLIILIIVTLCIWMACFFMINFIKMKREITLINDLERHQLQREINLDGLTGVRNKLALNKRFESVSGGIQEVAFLTMLDLDDFKKINDTYGHIFGDDVLKCMGEALRNMPDGVEAYRYGGDEFCVVFTDGTLKEVIQEIKNIQNFLEEHVVMADRRMNIFVSAGIVEYSGEVTVTELLLHADQALYESKTKQRNGITVYKKSESN